MPDHVDLVVGQWKRERPDLDVRSMAILARLWRFGRIAGAQVQSGFAEHGLQPGWFDVLSTLRRAGEPYELTPGALLESAMVSSGGMTKRLDRMEEAGLVRRSPDPEDRRGVRVRLTPAGLAAADAAVEQHVAREDALLAPLDAKERAALDALLRKLLAGLPT